MILLSRRLQTASISDECQLAQDLIMFRQNRHDHLSKQILREGRMTLSAETL